jgi:hypothetical protein
MEKRWVKMIGLRWLDLTQQEKNEMVHICIMGKMIGAVCTRNEKSVTERYHDTTIWSCSCGATGDMSSYKQESHLIPLPDYCGSYNAAMEAVKRVDHLDDESQRLFYQDLPPIHCVSPEELCWNVMRAFGYSVTTL